MHSKVITAALATFAIGASVAATAVKGQPDPSYTIVRQDVVPPRPTVYGTLYTDQIRDERTGIVFFACQTDEGEADCTTGAPP